MTEQTNSKSKRRHARDPKTVTATGWLPHTMRAALTGLKKKGHAIDRSKRDDVTCYRITKSA